MDVVHNAEHPALDDQDESVRIAVTALGDMRNSVHTSPSTCKPYAPPLCLLTQRSPIPCAACSVPAYAGPIDHIPLQLAVAARGGFAGFRLEGLPLPHRWHGAAGV